MIIVIAVLLALYFLIHMYSYINSCISCSKKLAPYKKDFELISQRLIDLKNEYNVDYAILDKERKCISLENYVDKNIKENIIIKEIPLNEIEISSLKSLSKISYPNVLTLVWLENDAEINKYDKNCYDYYLIF